MNTNESPDTKRLIADSLKELSKEKSFDKISVGEIAARSNVNRQTFYYHFQDKFGLLEWIYMEDYFRPNMKDLSWDNWDVCLTGILEAVYRDRAFCINTIKHTEEIVKVYFLRDAESIFDSAIEYLRGQVGFGDQALIRINADEQRYIARFFAYGVCGMLIEWIQQGMKEEPSLVASRMQKLLVTCKHLAYQQVLDEKKENGD